eukprot:1266106-Prymnesium_polylepis.1
MHMCLCLPTLTTHPDHTTHPDESLTRATVPRVAPPQDIADMCLTLQQQTDPMSALSRRADLMRELMRDDDDDAEDGWIRSAEEEYARARMRLHPRPFCSR